MAGIINISYYPASAKMEGMPRTQCVHVTLSPHDVGTPVFQYFHVMWRQISDLIHSFCESSIISAFLTLVFNVNVPVLWQI